MAFTSKQWNEGLDEGGRGHRPLDDERRRALSGEAAALHVGGGGGACCFLRFSKMGRNLWDITREELPDGEKLGDYCTDREDIR